MESLQYCTITALSSLLKSAQRLMGESRTALFFKASLGGNGATLEVCL